MCGIAGIIKKDSPTLGNDLINMLNELIHRGKDATGVAIYEKRDSVDLRVSLSEASYQPELEKIIQKYGTPANSRTYPGQGIFTFYEASINMDTDKISELNWDIDSHPNLCVHSIGKRIKIYKDEGSAERERSRVIGGEPGRHRALYAGSRIDHPGAGQFRVRAHPEAGRAHLRA